MTPVFKIMHHLEIYFTISSSFRSFLRRLSEVERQVPARIPPPVMRLVQR